jgi:nitroreductase
LNTQEVWFGGKETVMEIEKFIDLVKSRRSIRAYRPDPIPDEYVRQIIEAARWAPSGGNSQPWEFIVIKRKDVKEIIHYEEYDRSRYRTDQQAKDFIIELRKSDRKELEGLMRGMRGKRD